MLVHLITKNGQVYILDGGPNTKDQIANAIANTREDRFVHDDSTWVKKCEIEAIVFPIDRGQKEVKN